MGGQCPSLTSIEMNTSLTTTIFVVVFACAVYSSRERYHSTDKHLLAKSARNGQEQYIDCYEFPNRGGRRLRLTDYAPALSKYNFDNIISSCCVTGIWLLYQDTNYNSANAGASSYYVYGDQYCVDLPQGFDNQASSVRYTGAPDDWRASTLNFYQNEYFIGGEEFTYADITQLNYAKQAESIIVSGCDAWTLYDQPNYKGNCACVHPSDTTKCIPGFYSTKKALGSMAKRVTSAKRGCHCTAAARVNPENAPKPKSLLSKTAGDDLGNSAFYATRN